MERVCVRKTICGRCPHGDEGYGIKRWKGIKGGLTHGGEKHGIKRRQESRQGLRKE